MVQCAAGKIYDGGRRFVCAGSRAWGSSDDDGLVLLVADYWRTTCGGSWILAAANNLEKGV